MIGQMIDTTTLTPSEDIQDETKVDAIVAVIDAEMDWDEQPAIIVDEHGVIIDGHHRVVASLESGLNTWRALIVERSTFDALESRVGWQQAVLTVADDADDFVTWGHCSN